MLAENQTKTIDPGGLLAEIRRRLDAVFSAYAAGTDVSPGERLRLEGFMQAVIYLQLVSRQQLIQTLQQSHRDCLGVELDDLFPPQDDAAVLPIPPRMRRAPVVPTTSGRT